MRKWISLLFIVALLLPTMAARPQVREKSKGGVEAVETAQRRVEEAQRKTQAIELLKGVVESTAEIQKPQTRVNLLIAALDLLWKHDEAYARGGELPSVVAAL